MLKQAYIEETPEGFYVRSERTGRNLGGPYATREEALRRLMQIAYFKRLAKLGSRENSQEEDSFIMRKIRSIYFVRYSKGNSKNI